MMSAMVTSGRGELLDVAMLAVDPLDGRVVALLLDSSCRPYFEIGASGSSLTSLPARIGHLVVEQFDQLPQDPALRLAAEPEQDEVVAGEHRVDDLRDDRVVVPLDAGKQRLAET